MTMEQPLGHGFILEPLIDTDYRFGGVSKLKGEVINPGGDWLGFLPDNEFQAPLFETNACTCFGATNAIEILTKFTFGKNLNLSDRFAAKGSGVDPLVGNTPKRAADFLRKSWSVNESEWPMEGVQSVEEYYKEISDLLYSKAQILKGDNVFGYEYVQPMKTLLKEALKRGPVGMSCALMLDENGLWYKPAGWRDTHWVTLVKIRENGNYVIYDSYSPFIKEVRGDFVSEFAYRYELNEELVDAITRLINAIKKWLGL